MNHQRSLRCLCAAPLAAAVLLGSPAEAALGGALPAIGDPPLPSCALPVSPAAAQGSVAARLAPASRARIARAEGVAPSSWRRR